MARTILLLALCGVTAAIEAPAGMYTSLAGLRAPSNELLYGGVGVSVLLAAGAGAFFYMKSKQSEKAEKDVDCEEGEAEPLIAQEPEQIQETEKIQETQEPQDYDELVQNMMQKAQDKFGPKLQSGGEVATILQDKAEGFADKAKALVMNEFNDTAGAIAQALEAEDFMAMLEWDSAIAANFPPLSVLLAGLMVPVNLAITNACHLSQVLLVLLPVLGVTAYSEYADWDHPCQSIPGLRVWARIVLATALAVIMARIAMMSRISSAQSSLAEKSKEMRAQLAKAESAGDDVSIGDLRELFIAHSTTLQYAVVCESRCNSSIFSHIVGAGTLIWLLSTFFNMYIYFGYLFVPGVVAFHESAAGDPTYCGAWVTACASKIANLVAVLFFFMNVVTVFFWVTQTVMNSSSFAKKMSDGARAFDSANMGIPAAQLLVRAFFVRSQADVLISKFAVSVREKSALSQEYADTESRLIALKSQVERKEAQVNKMQETMDAQGGGTMEAAVERMTESGLDFTAMQAKASVMIDNAKAQAAELEIAATDEIEKLVEKLQELMKTVTDSESFKAAQAKAEEAAEQAKAAAEEAAAQAQELAEQAKASAAEAAEQAQAMAVEAQKQGQALAEQAQAAAK